MADKPQPPQRMGKLQISYYKAEPVPPGTKSPVKGGTLFFAEERAARRRFWILIGATLSALVAGILIGRFLLG